MWGDYEEEFYHLHDAILNWDKRGKNAEFWINYYLDTVNKEYWEIDKNFKPITRSRPEIYSDLRKLINGRIVIPFLDFSVNTACSLRCKHCSQALPYLKNNRIFSSDELVDELNLVFKKVDYIHLMSLIGGEPFLNKDLDSFLLYVSKLKKQGKIGDIRIVTNGTIIPSKFILRELSGEGIYVLISNYDKTLTNEQLEKREELVRIFEECNINFCLSNSEKKWLDIGIFDGKCKSENLKESFMTCPFKNCFYLVNGILYHCSRQYMATEIHNLLCEENEVINFHLEMNDQAIRDKIYELYSIDSVSACRMCLPCSKRKSICAGEQIINE